MTTKVTGSVLADTAVTPGTYGGTQTLKAFTVDAQGRITYAANITSGVITAGTRGQGADIIVPTIQYNALGQIVAATNTTIRTATTSVTGVVQLADSVSNTSTSAAATPNSVTTTYNHAGNAFNQANLAFTTANSASTSAGNAGNVAALAFTQANSASTSAGNAGGVAAAAFTQANSAAGIAASAFTQANNALNASNISSGTLPSARISGSYTGITAVGTLSTGSIPGTLISSAVSSATNATNATNVSGTGTVTVANLATDAKPVGAGQTWQNLTASRAINVTYTNDTGRPIMVNITGAFTVNQYVEILIGGSVVVAKAAWDSLASGRVWGTVSAIVPAGNTYQATSTGLNTMSWAELR
jgi:hypothetical protein